MQYPEVIHFTDKNTDSGRIMHSTCLSSIALILFPHLYPIFCTLAFCGPGQARGERGSSGRAFHQCGQVLIDFKEALVSFPEEAMHLGVRLYHFLGFDAV